MSFSSKTTLPSSCSMSIFSFLSLSSFFFNDCLNLSFSLLTYSNSIFISSISFYLWIESSLEPSRSFCTWSSMSLIILRHCSISPINTYFSSLSALLLPLRYSFSFWRCSTLISNLVKSYLFFWISPSNLYNFSRSVEFSVLSRLISSNNFYIWSSRALISNFNCFRISVDREFYSLIDEDDSSYPTSSEIFL